MRSRRDPCPHPRSPFFWSLRGLGYALVCLACVSCASDTGIFPTVTLDTAENTATLPNPISIVTDVANNQILVANSNVDIFFDSGSLAILSFDVTNPTAPTLTAAQVIAAPNFAGDIYADGVGSVFIPFRESSAAEEGRDRLIEYTLTAGNIALVQEVTVASDPLGITGDANGIYVVSDDVLGIFGTDLSHVIDVPLTTAEDADLDDSDSEFVESVAIDAANNRAIVSNRGGRMFVVDFTGNELVQVLAGADSTRDVLVDGNLLYALDGGARQVWVYDLNDLGDPTEIPETIDDSKIVVATVSVGTDPSGMALDAANDRLYVANAGDNTVSVVDTLTFLEIARIPVDAEGDSFNRAIDEPQGLALGTFGGTTYLFVAGFSSNAVGVIHTGRLELVEVFPNTEE